MLRTHGLAMALLVLAVLLPLIDSSSSSNANNGANKPRQRSSKPNVVLFLTDDQDDVLGGFKPMRRTQRLLSEQGSTAENWFIHTPVCCPSRAQLLTGRYFHNVKMPTSTGGCMHANCDPKENAKWNDWLYAPHLHAAGVKVGHFGKYLNSYVPLGGPPGISRWFANGGGNYMNPEFNDDGVPRTFNASEFAGYSTSVIGNTSLTWIKDQVRANGPFMAYIAVKAPHIQDGPGWPVTIPAPWHNTTFPGLAAPRTPNWNMSATDHHWLIRSQPPITDEQANRADALYRSRWQSLLAVDDLVADVIETIERERPGVTYYIFTSDHGYQFGQFRLVQGKWNVYETNLRIPFVIRGPGIRANTSFPYIGTNVDVMPTILSLAGVAPPPSMDGKSIAPLLVNPESRDVPTDTQKLLLSSPSAASNNGSSPLWRTEALVEYYGLGNVVRYEHLEDTFNNTYRAMRAVHPSPLGNILYAEFTDPKLNWNFTQPATEFELFDMDTDPWQMTNLYTKAGENFRRQLSKRLEELFRCQGSTCN